MTSLKKASMGSRNVAKCLRTVLYSRLSKSGPDRDSSLLIDSASVFSAGSISKSTLSGAGDLFSSCLLIMFETLLFAATRSSASGSKEKDATALTRPSISNGFPRLSCATER